MSTTSLNNMGELPTTGPTFSYAQAAKGHSGSQALVSDSSKAASEASDSTGKINDLPRELENTDAAQTVANGESAAMWSSELRETGKTNQTMLEAGTAESSIPIVPDASLPNIQELDLTPSSPTLNNAPIMNLAKDEEISATPNESESTWDKVSQNSESEGKPETKHEGDDDDSKLSSWEHVPPPAQLKEAPPPTVNFWQKRAADAKIKTYDVKSLQSPGNQNQKNESLPGMGQRKGSEPSIDTGKMDNKRKPSGNRQLTDEKSPAAKDFVKLGESKFRIGDEEKAVARGSRPQGSNKPSSAPPPPPNDAVSWPTPDSAKEEEKKKPQDRNEKLELEKTPNKPHGKEKWVQMPYVPTAVFNTPLPTARRGGRTARGGRESSGRGSHTINGSVGGGERNQVGGLPGASATPSTERMKAEMGPPRPGPLSPRAKRASSAGPSTAREQRRTGDSPQSKTEELSQKPFSGARSIAMENRRTSSTRFDGLQQGSPPERKLQSTERDSGLRIHSGSHDHAHPRSVSGRSDIGGRPQDFTREISGFAQSRERGEGRPERGRGGYRGRGGHNGFSGGHTVNGQGFAIGPALNTNTQGFPPKSQSYTEQRHQSQSQNTSFGNSREPRHYRTGSRSHSIPNPTFGRYSGNGALPSNQQLPQLQTEVANAYYQQAQPGIMSAMPFPNYLEQMQLSSMVQMQMEYYFSVDNLCKDMFLRKNMDSQGFVFLTVLQNFNRIKQLTADLELIRLVCWRSSVIELLTGGDGIDRVRKAQDWQQWVMNLDDRVSSAQNEGPSQLQQPQLPLFGPNEGQRVTVGSPRSSFTSSQHRPDPIVMNGHNTSSQTSDGQFTQTPLSAAVPDFTPSLQPLNPQSSQTLDTSTAETTFSDEQIESLMIVVRKPNASGLPLRSPIASPAASTSQKFTNGSVDRERVEDEHSSLDHNGTAPGIISNGDHPPESGSSDMTRRPRSPLTFGTAPRQPSSTTPPVFWVKNKDTPIDDLPNDLTYELYTTFRRDALNQREQMPKGQPHHDMDILFQFWSHFLIRNFNYGMYEEFRHLAFEDATRRDSQMGLKNLISFYDELVLGPKVISDSMARDYVELVRTEVGRNDRPAFDRLRAAWRNGALPLKNRVKIDRLIEANLKTELES